MRPSFARIPGRVARAALDSLVVLWLAAWIVLGFAVGHEVRGLTDLSNTTVAAGFALEDTGRALEELGNVPLVGERVGEIGERAVRAGQSARASGRTSRDSIESLATLLTVTIAIVPSLPLLALYVPFRLAWAREVGSLRRALRRDPNDPLLRELLARRAAQNLPFDALGANPWRELEAGRYDRLAELELARLGLRPPTPPRA